MLAAIVLSGTGIGAQAACDSGLAEGMHAKLHPGRALDHERAVCRPGAASLAGSSSCCCLPRTGGDPDEAEYDLDVMVVQQADNGNTERSTVVSRLYQPAALSEDAVRISAIRIDTARYGLADDTRAFGVRVARQGRRGLLRTPTRR